jgi:hypothetical protein
VGFVGGVFEYTGETIEYRFGAHARTARYKIELYRSLSAAIPSTTVIALFPDLALGGILSGPNSAKG